jgi:hypothetical protein
MRSFCAADAKAGSNIASKKNVVFVLIIPHGKHIGIPERILKCMPAAMLRVRF